MAWLDPLFWIATAFLLPQAAVIVVNLVTFPVLERVRPDDLGRAGTVGAPGGGVGVGAVQATVPRPRVSILVPVRDEADDLPVTLPTWLAQDAHEVLVLDDGSTDGSAEILAAHAASQPRLRVIAGAPLPAGWTGKNWACHQLSLQATGDIWAFTDADVQWGDEALEALLALQRKRQTGLTTVWPRTIVATWFERLVVPGVDLLLLAALPHPAVSRVPFSSVAGGNGQLMMFTPNAYARAGGHEAVRREVLDDVRLAQRAKAAGVGLALALGGEVMATRMYRTREEVIEGFAKNILDAAGGSVAALWLVAVLNTLAYALVWPLALVETRWLVLGLLGMAMRAGVAWKTRRSPLEGPLQGLFPVGLWPIVLRATLRGGAFIWKGRAYP